ncbi:MAG: alpha/beta hydrolase fold domain-containing protein, partial [Acetobacter malorum]
MRVSAEPETAQGIPARPNFYSRILLGWIRWQGARSKAGPSQKFQPVAKTLCDEAAARAEFLAVLRKAMDTPSFPTRLSALGIRKVLTISVPGATGPMQARLYLPYGRIRGAVLYLHGGGFVHCGLNSHHGMCCRLARVSGAAVLLPDYRLAPEHPYPAAADDSQAALRWLAGMSARFWGGKVAVAGDSAGGNLAAVLA